MRIALDDNIYIFGKSGVTNINDAIATLSSMIKRLYGDVNIDVKHNDSVLDKLVEIYKNNYKLKLAEHVKERRAQSKLFYNN
jgi:transcriptional regulator